MTGDFTSSPPKDPEVCEWTFADAARLDSTLQHLSELNYTVSQLKQDHRTSSLNIDSVKDKLSSSLSMAVIDIKRILGDLDSLKINTVKSLFNTKTPLIGG